MGIHRAYFINAETGEELPLSGKAWIGTSANVRRNGEYVKGTCTFVEIADFASLHKVIGRRIVTAKDFNCKVKVKTWHGPGVPPDYRLLVPEEG